MSGSGGRAEGPRPARGWRDAALPRRTLVLTPLLFLVAAVAVGLVWWRWADPPVWVVADGVGYLSEAERARVFGLVALYGACSAPPALVLGAVLGWVQRGLSWTHVLLLTGSAAAAALVSWRLGVLLGPPDPQSAFEGLANGERVSGAVDLDAYGVLLVWPLGALLALLIVGIVLVPDDRPDPDASPTDDATAPADQGPAVGRGPVTDPGNP